VLTSWGLQLTPAPDEDISGSKGHQPETAAHGWSQRPTEQHSGADTAYSALRLPVGTSMSRHQHETETTNSGEDVYVDPLDALARLSSSLVPARGFMHLDEADATFATARVIVLPVPF